jgi:hypothetical protein
MKRVPIYRNDPAYLLELRRSGDGRVPPMKPVEVAQLSGDVYVLVGARSSDARESGLAATGYVMVSNKAVGSVPVTALEVQCAVLNVK